MSAQTGIAQINIQRPTYMYEYTHTNTGASMLMVCTMPSTHKHTCAETHKYSQRHIPSLLCKSTRAYMHMHSLLHACTYLHQLQTSSCWEWVSLPGFVLRMRAFTWQILLGKALPVDSLTSARMLSSLWTLQPVLISARRNLKSPEPTAGTGHDVSTLGFPLGNYACAPSLG